MKIVIETIPHSEQRYRTLGDYWRDPDGTLQIRVSNVHGNNNFHVLIALHELVEVILCEARGIAEPDIMKFDVEHPYLDDPGNSPDAPYHSEHVFAECLERLFARELDVDWLAYELQCETMF